MYYLICYNSKVTDISEFKNRELSKLRLAIKQSSNSFSVFKTRVGLVVPHDVTISRDLGQGHCHSTRFVELKMIYITRVSDNLTDLFK